MDNLSRQSRCFSLSPGPVRRLQKWLAFVLAVGFFSTPILPVRALEADNQYMSIYRIIDKADELAKAGNKENAIAKYVEADKALRELRRDYPKYNPKLIAARLEYIAEKVEALSKPPPLPEEEVAYVPGGAGAGAQSEPEVTLLEAGAEPLNVLRFQGRASASLEVSISANVKTGVEMAGESGGMESVPAITLTATVTQKSPEPDGSAQFEATINGLSVKAEEASSPMAGLIEGQLAQMKGLVVTGTMSDRYRAQKIATRVPRGVSPHLRQNIDDTKNTFATEEFTLPEEPIGVGARWEVKYQLKQGGITADVVARNELVSATNGILVLKTTSTKTAAKQKISNPIMPTLKVNMSKLVSTSTGTATIDLGRVVPVNKVTTEHSEMSMSMNLGGEDQTVTVKTETTSTLTSK